MNMWKHGVTAFGCSAALTTIVVVLSHAYDVNPVLPATFVVIYWVTYVALRLTRSVKMARDEVLTALKERNSQPTHAN